VNLDHPVVSLRSLTSADYAVARRIVATAFAGEPFAVGMFGESALDRFAGMAREYSTWPWASNPVGIAAEVGDSLVAVAIATLPGACQLCDGFDKVEHPQSTRAEQIEYQFQLACRNAHLAQNLPPHAHIATVATDLFLRGCGIGERVVHELIERLWSEGARCAVLECLTTREQFYVRAGFTRIADFADPAGPTLRSALMRFDGP
jgi:ribosomal protein S18 acetylase RimI-like enzyme